MDSSTDIITDVVTTVVTTVAVEDPFNYTGMWISMGVLGGFVLCVMVYGLGAAIFGTFKLPDAEEKEPLAGDGVDDQKQATPSVDQTIAPSSKAPSGINNSAADLTERGDGDTRDVAVEVYEQSVDTADELKV